MPRNLNEPAPRRRSIFSGLLLVLLGVLFLIHNFHGDFPLWQILERWWPLLFIIWGVSKLYDRLMASRTGEAAPATISAGEIFLVFILLVVVASAAGLDWVNGHGNRNDFINLPWEDSYPFTEDVAAKTVPANAQITIRADRGDITVHADDTAEIHASVRKTAYADNETDAQRRANQLHVTINTAGGGFVVEPEGSSSGGRPVRTDMDVHIPKGATLSVETGNGTVQVNGVMGNVTVEARGGDTEIRQSGGDVSVDTNHGNTTILGANGDVKVSGHASEVEISDVKGSATLDGEFYGPLRFERVAKGVRFVSNRTDLTVSELSGRIEVSSGGNLTVSDARGNVTLTTRQRDVTLDNVSGHIHVENRDGNVTLRFPQPPKEDIEIANQSGDVSLLLPEKSSFTINARADHNGDIETEFGDSAKVNSDRESKSLSDTVGAHGPNIQLRTTYGTIHLRKGQP
jgi:hypothetical protein